MSLSFFENRLVDSPALFEGINEFLCVISKCCRKNCSSSYNNVTAGSVEQYVYYHLPIRSYSLKDAPEDGPVRSETP
jgi:hypothetical protein